MNANNIPYAYVITYDTTGSAGRLPRKVKVVLLDQIVIDTDVISSVYNINIDVKKQRTQK